MGFIYKLTEDVVEFILDQKQKFPHLTCRELADLVSSGFQRDISKSSVHEVLRQAHMSGQRGRKSKSKFQIPKEKKAKLFADAPPALAPKEPAIKEARQPAENAAFPESSPASVGVPLPPKPLKPLERKDLRTAGEVFLRAAFLDLFPSGKGAPKPFNEFKSMGVNDLQAELDYRSIAVCFYQIEYEGGVFFIDGRFQALYRQLPLTAEYPIPIENGLASMADCLLTNVQPIVIYRVGNDVSKEDTEVWCRVLEGTSDAAIKSISLLDAKASVVASFTGISPQKRLMSIGVGSQEIANNEFMSIDSKFCEFYGNRPGIAYEQGELWGHPALRLPAPHGVVLTNAAAADWETVRAYLGRHGQGLPALQFPLPTAAVDGAAWLQAYVAPWFEKPLSENEWVSVLALEGYQDFNEEISLTTLCLSPDFPLNSALASAAQNINGLGLKDEQNRPIYIELALK